MATLLVEDQIQNSLVFVRNHLVLLHTNLARIYGGTPQRLLHLAETFPGDFCFALESGEIALLLNDTWDGRLRLHAFTEHGAVHVAYLINSPQSTAKVIEVARAFVWAREHSFHPLTTLHPAY